MNPTTTTSRHTSRRNRGSVYLLILGASLLTLVIGVSGLIASRLTHSIAANESDVASAKALAVAAVDRGLLVIRDAGPGWRTALANADITEEPLANGSYTLIPEDPIDNDLTDSPSDPVTLTGIGIHGQARQLLQVTLNASGKPLAGSWKQSVE